MAFTATLLSKKQLPGGKVLEEYSWVADSGTTTGTITADVTQQPQVILVEQFGASSNGDTAVVCATDAGDNKLKLTFTANDSGKAFLLGKAA